LEFSLWK